jgi:enoyl-CoA hydratase/carnithine racemase
MAARWRAPDRLPAGLRYEEVDRVATLTLSRPERLNALTFDVYTGLRDVFAGLKKRRDVRAVVLTGEGRGFCSGGDVDEIIGALLGREFADLERFSKMTCDTVARMRACPQPVVAALNGVVAGAGAALAMASDFRLAVPEAKISFLFIKAGLSGADMGACLLLPRLVGLGRATELLMLGDALPAAEAHRMGLYNRLVEPERLRDEARNLARRLADGPAEALRVTKHSLDHELSLGLKEALAYEARVQAECMTHPDFREAHDAFKAKRKPRFA